MRIRFQRVGVCAAVSAALIPAHAQTTKPASSSAGAFDHSPFDALLKQHFKADGNVDYEGLQRDAAALDGYVAAIGAAPYDTLGRDEQMCLLINAYNAFTLRLILDHWPLKSIRDIPESKRWDDGRWKIGPMTLSLNQIENDYLRPKFNEPRIHFAVNCASVGCPPLRAEAYVPARLEQQLQEQAERVNRDPRWVRFDAKSGVLKLTPLYDWYGADFKAATGSVEAYVARFNPNLNAALQSKWTVTIEWLDYDWSVNAAAR